MKKDFFKWLFQITSVKKGKYIAFMVCGKRILCVPKFSKKISKQQYLQQKIDFISNFLKVTTDIKKIPQAHGTLKMIQQGSVCILKEFSKIAKKHKIRWWLDSGTLIGAIRHNGFIPWDDDIDIAVTRNDYEKLQNILEKEFTKNGFFFKRESLCQLFYKDVPAQVDIFPMDCGFQKKPIEGREYKLFCKKLDKIKDDFKWKFKYKGNIANEVKKQLDNLFSKRPAVEHGFYFFGVETRVRNRCVFAEEDIFPLKPFSFYGISTYVPNNYEYYLWSQYGDYMSFPEDCCPKHPEIEAKLNRNSFINLQYLIKKYTKDKE